VLDVELLPPVPPPDDDDADDDAVGGRCDVSFTVRIV
jgi:hypothetical protein